jgi:adenylate cyclase
VDARTTGETLVFDGWHFDRQARLLYRQDAIGTCTPVPIGSRAQDILTLLLEHPGTLVSKDTIMEAVWPNTAVEANNLNVQIAALRRVLDRDRSDGSYIQTVSGRGYRFAVPVHRRGEAPRPPYSEPINGNATVDDRNAETGGDRIVTAPDIAASMGASPGANRFMRHQLRALLAALLALVVGASLFLGSLHKFWISGSNDRPRLSLVVLPFDNLSGDTKDDYLADSVTDDLTSDLSNLPDTFVIARETAYTYKRKPADVRKIGEELGVRYVLEGSVRKIATTLRVNVQLTSGETGVHLWSDRFDEQISELATGQEQIVTRMRSELGVSLVEIEKARSLRERPTNPDAFDLVLQARTLENQPPSVQRNDEGKALYERALELDPSSVAAMVGIAYYLIDRRATTGSWGTLENKQRAESLLTQARAIAPGSQNLLSVTAYWLRIMRRCGEAMAIAEEAIRRFPNYARGYSQLAQCQAVNGHAEEEIPLMQKAIRVNPRGPYLFNYYRLIGEASLMLGRDQDAIDFFERSLAVSPDNDGNRPWTYRDLAAAYARSGRMSEAKRALAEADRLYPYATVRNVVPNPSVPVRAEQLRRLQEGLRLAGERDHADEDADFGVAADGVLHSQLDGLTPTTAPGVRTIRTTDLAAFLAEARPLVIDASYYMWGLSIPGAVGLDNVGLGGSFADAAQDHLRRKMHELTGGDLNRPIIAVGWNSGSFRGRNLALRLVSLGYTNVYWYRGGREAWEVAGRPETELDVQDW